MCPFPCPHPPHTAAISLPIALTQILHLDPTHLLTGRPTRNNPTPPPLLPLGHSVSTILTPSPLTRRQAPSPSFPSMHAWGRLVSALKPLPPWPSPGSKAHWVLQEGPAPSPHIPLKVPGLLSLCCLVPKQCVKPSQLCGPTSMGSASYIRRP